MLVGGRERRPVVPEYCTVRSLSLCLLIIQQVVSGCMDWNVQTTDGTIKCIPCKECDAGYEPYPPCHTDEIYQEVGLVTGCIKCKDNFFKKVHHRKPNTLMCKACSTVRCKDNFVVLQNCSATNPPICSTRCKVGFTKDSIGKCVKKQGTGGYDPIPTFNPTSLVTSRGTLTVSKKKVTTEPKKPNESKEPTESKEPKDIQWEWILLIVISCVVVALFLIYMFWKKCGTKACLIKPRFKNDHENSSSLALSSSWDEDMCCFCKKPAGMLLSNVTGINLKFDNFSEMLADEKKVCNDIFNYLNGRSVPNNRIENTRDLYTKMFSQLQCITVAKFFKALKVTKQSGIIERIHDDFHPAEVPAADDSQ